MIAPTLLSSILSNINSQLAPFPPDPEQRVRGTVGRQQSPGHHGRADRQHGGQNELHSVLARRPPRHPDEVRPRLNPFEAKLDNLNVSNAALRCLVKQLEIFQQQQGSSVHPGQGPGGGGGQHQQQHQQGQRRILMTQGVNSNPPSTSSAALALSAGSGDSCGPTAAAATAAAPPAPPYSEVDFSASFADNFVRNRGQPATAAAGNPVQGSRPSANPSPGE